MITINYQSIIDLVAEILQVALPIALLFGISGKLVRMLISMVTGERRVKL